MKASLWVCLSATRDMAHPFGSSVLSKRLTSKKLSAPFHSLCTLCLVPFQSYAAADLRRHLLAELQKVPRRGAEDDAGRASQDATGHADAAVRGSSHALGRFRPPCSASNAYRPYLHSKYECWRNPGTPPPLSPLFPRFAKKMNVSVEIGLLQAMLEEDLSHMEWVSACRGSRKLCQQLQAYPVQSSLVLGPWWPWEWG